MLTQPEGKDPFLDAKMKEDREPPQKKQASLFCAREAVPKHLLPDCVAEGGGHLICRLRLN